MELSVKNMGQDSFSMEGGDSNAEILPPKRSNKKKRANEVCEDSKVKKNQKLSKSQKRKLKKMEEDKEKALLYSKSIEMLEKYKIPEDAYSLLRSSKSIGRAETLMEKRRMAVQFSKAGFEVPHTDGFLKGRSPDETSCEAETDVDKIQARDIYENSPVQSIITEIKFLNKTPDSLLCPQKLSHSYELGSDGGSNGSLFADKASAEVNCLAIQEGISLSTTKIPGHDDRQISNPTDGVDEIKNKDASRSTNLADCSLQRPVMSPTVIHVLRPDEVENKRKDLPIVMMEQEIMEAINDQSTVIICGETGCGKTTQVPQFLYEAGFGSKQHSARSGIIGVTQPRRVAVLATAKRVAFELGLHLGKEIGFQVRYDKQIGESCSLKFMTDGILLREVQTDMLLRRYSVIILDEAHERSLNTDILIGMVSRVIRARQHLYEEQRKMVLSGQSISSENIIFPIKLILMSATLRVEDFISGRRLFREPPPVIEVPTRQFPVTIHFSKRTEVVDYIGQAYKKVMSIHRRLPQGGILVFVTGQREVEHLCQKLRKASRELNLSSSKGNVRNEVTDISEMSCIEGMNMKEINEAFDVNRNSTHQGTDRFSSYENDFYDNQEDDESDHSYDSETDSDLEIINEDWNSPEQKICDNNDNLVGVLGDNGSLTSLKAAFEALAGKNGFYSNPGSSKESMPVDIEESSGQTSSRMEKTEDEDRRLCAGALHVLPLYAMLPAAAQLRVFEEVKEGERLVVVATNVAETSLTIPGIKYVVDTGREKVKNYNPATGMETYEIQWISKASAAQRAGRAGRTGPGHCYRLYSSAVFNNIFPDFSCAEISKVPVAGVILLLKSMGISKVANFPFPTPPEPTSLVQAERCLKTLEALDYDGNLTSLGKAMAYFPMSPRHSRMLLTVIHLMRKVRNYARANKVLGYAVATAAALSLSNPFIMQFGGSPADKKDLDNDDKCNASEVEEIVNKQEKLRKKKLKEAAKESRTKFSNPRSDALTVAYALQCFELSTSQGDFCNQRALHLKTMEEMSKLRKQLLQLVFNQNVNSDVGHDFSWPHGTMEDVEQSWRIASSKCPLLYDEEELLGQAVCAGWADRVAKRIRGVSGLSEGDRKANAVRYRACMVKETVFLHRWSSVSSSAPEFLVYSELLHTNRPYMHGATSVKSDWLVKYAGSLCTFSAPLTDPKPYYEPQADQVFCWVIPTFGPHLWELPLHSLPITSDVHRVAVFAYSLLEGHVLPCLRSVRKFMTAPPGTILRPEASGQKRVGNLLYKLKARSIDSCRMLRKAWDENPKVLYSEVLDWFQESFHNQFEELWSKMLHEVCLEPQERYPKKTKKDIKRSKLLV